MSAKQIALHTYPYWLLGLMMLFLTARSSYAKILKIDYCAILKWCGLLLCMTVFRVLLFKLAPQQEIKKFDLSGMLSIPPWMALTTFWEDSVFGLPLVLLSMMLPDRWYKKPILKVSLGTTMLSFMIGHLYQGILAAILLSFYIPFSVSRIKQYGLTTVIFCHSLYDLVTILTFRWLLG